MKVIQRRVLHNTTDNHNKFYEANLCILDGVPSNVAYAVVCRWGRIECFSSDSAQKQVKVNGTTYARATDIFEDICHQKVAKGYVQVGKDMIQSVTTIEEEKKYKTLKPLKAKPLGLKGEPKDDKLEVIAGFNWFEDYDNERTL